MVNEQIVRFLETNSSCAQFEPPPASAKPKLYDFANQNSINSILDGLVNDALSKSDASGGLVLNNLLSVGLKETQAGADAVLPNGASFVNLFNVTIASGTYMEQVLTCVWRGAAFVSRSCTKSSALHRCLAGSITVTAERTLSCSGLTSAS